MTQKQTVLYGVPDLEKKCETTQALFLKDQMAVNQELLRRSINALQKAFGKRRKQYSTTVWLMVHRTASFEEILLFRKKVDEAAAHVQPIVESFGCSVDTSFVDKAYTEGKRLIFSTMTFNRRKGKRIHGVVGMHLSLARRKKAHSRYQLTPRLNKKIQNVQGSA